MSEGICWFWSSPIIHSNEIPLSDFSTCFISFKNCCHDLFYHVSTRMLEKNQSHKFSWNSNEYFTAFFIICFPHALAYQNGWATVLFLQNSCSIRRMWFILWRWTKLRWNASRRIFFFRMIENHFRSDQLSSDPFHLILLRNLEDVTEWSLIASARFPSEKKRFRSFWFGIVMIDHKRIPFHFLFFFLFFLESESRTNIKIILKNANEIVLKLLSFFIINFMWYHWIVAFIFM